jgi:hypothetical protein
MTSLNDQIVKCDANETECIVLVQGPASFDNEKGICEMGTRNACEQLINL